MVLAPAIGIACLQVLGWLSFLVTLLSGAVILKQAVAPNENFDLGGIMAVAAVFGAGGLGCRWGARALQRAADA